MRIAGQQGANLACPHRADPKSVADTEKEELPQPKRFCSWYLPVNDGEARNVGIVSHVMGYQRLIVDKCSRRIQQIHLTHNQSLIQQTSPDFAELFRDGLCDFEKGNSFMKS